MRRTALVVLVPEASPLVDAFRARHLADAVARGLPPHITILYPFVPARELDEGTIETLAGRLGAVPAFGARLTGVGAFEDTVWLRPAPEARFQDAIRRVRAWYPGFPPYGDPDHVSVPHLTLGAVDGETPIGSLRARAEREIGPGLPVAFTVDRLALLEEDTRSVFGVRALLPLGPAAPDSAG